MPADQSIQLGELFVSVVVFSAFLVAALLVLIFISRFASQLAKKSKTELDDNVVKAARAPAFALVLVAGIYYAALCVPSIGEYLIYIRKGTRVIAIVIAALFAARAINIVAAWLMDKKSKKAELHGMIVKTIKAPAYLLVVLAGLYYVLLSIPSIEAQHVYIRKGAGVLTIVIAALLAVRVINLVAKWYSDKLSLKADADVQTKIVRTVRNVVKAIVWIVALFLFLHISEIDIGPVATSLGISGIIVALALQSVLADLLTSFTIYLDRPFETGDYVYIGELKGTIEKVGFYSTRLRALRGEEIIVSNKEIRSKTVQNFKKMARRRVAFQIGVTYDTPAEKLRRIPEMIKRLIDDVPLASADRAHFFNFGAYSLDFEIVYYISTNDYTIYMDIQQRINLAIVELFEAEGIEFAYPTQTLIVEIPKQV